MSGLFPSTRARAALAAAASALLVAACGGGGSSTTSGDPQGTTVGTVTGFGSLIVDGVRYDDRNATTSVDSPSGAPDAASGVEVKLGQRVEMRHHGLGADDNGGTATSVMVSAEVIGPVTAVSPDLVVAGQTIRINSDPAAGPVTVFDGFASAADIQVGDRVEVHGTPIDASTVLASRIERKPSLMNWVRVTGNIANLAADGSSFDLGGLTVLVDTSTRVIPAGAKLADGLRVSVWSRNAPSANTVTAAFIRVKRAQEESEFQMRLAGAVTDCTAPCAANFKVAGFTINAANAQFIDGTAADLADGKWVELRGQVDATSGVFVASRVRFRMRDDIRNDVRLIGSISDFVDMQHFMVRGVSVSTDGNTRIGALCPSPLANGTLVAINGSVANATVLAKRIECLPSFEGITIDARGTVGTVDAANQTFTLGNSLLGNLTLHWTSATQFSDGRSAADLIAGARVRVRGTVEGGVMTLSRVQFEDDLPQPNGVVLLETEGTASHVTLVGGAVSSFTVNGLVITVAPATVIELRDGPLVDGAKVKVLFTRQGAANVAVFVRTDH